MLFFVYSFRFLNKLIFFSCGNIRVIISKQKESLGSFKKPFESTSFRSSSSNLSDDILDNPFIFCLIVFLISLLCLILL